VEVWQTSNLRPLRLGEEKARKKKNKRQDENIYGLPYYVKAATNNSNKNVHIYGAVILTMQERTRLT